MSRRAAAAWTRWVMRPPFVGEAQLSTANWQPIFCNAHVPRLTLTTSDPAARGRNRFIIIKPHVCRLSEKERLGQCANFTAPTCWIVSQSGRDIITHDANGQQQHMARIQFCTFFVDDIRVRVHSGRIASCRCPSMSDYRQRCWAPRS